MIRKIVRLFSLILLAFFSAYLILVSSISIVIGFTNTHRAGFWMPIVCGGLLLILTSFLVRLIVYIIKQARSKDKYLYV
ncbi:MAG: hypothetical protein DRG87_11955 [Deltaproteobacteria bacterium]|nr:hypothetical protein [Deltaproteobacteria bacterium]MBW2076974.1 hypothetical protein [Deltaproteobacteria bacterium]MBW2310477.1 hypothetical protein [Deltaproteobacteria bacterium]RLB27212.1 MAG: hypothetical protein DRG87_11955 [Deltaproteobacteria bacterium]